MCELKIIDNNGNTSLEMSGVPVVDVPFWGSKYCLVIRLWEETIANESSVGALMNSCDSLIMTEELAKCLDTIIEVVKVSGEIGKLSQEEQG